eukprot:4418998-Amphidinium_carterae.1
MQHAQQKQSRVRGQEVLVPRTFLTNSAGEYSLSFINSCPDRRDLPRESFNFSAVLTATCLRTACEHTPSNPIRLTPQHTRLCLFEALLASSATLRAFMLSVLRPHLLLWHCSLEQTVAHPSDHTRCA